MRLSWPIVWMNVAETISQRSCDEQLKVGAIIVPEDNTSILAIGYNGDERGGQNKRISEEPGQSGFLHAEINCLIKCDFSFHKKKHMYITHHPCPMCCKAIVNAGITKVFYKNVYRDTSGTNILEKANISINKIETS